MPERAQAGSKVLVGAYFFDGWSGPNPHADDPSQPWAAQAPSHLSRRMLEEFPEREPLWGWRDDALEIMERQIDLAADHGIAFFAFCWYWHDDRKPINLDAIRDDPKHISLSLFLRARNRDRMKFCLLVANHDGSQILGTDAWKQAADHWIPLLKHPRHVTLDGKPLLIIFSPAASDPQGLHYLQHAAHAQGLPGVAVAGCNAGTVEQGYTLRTHYNRTPGYTSGSEPHAYRELVDYHKLAWKGAPELPYIPEVTVGWDKRPWEGPDGLDQKPGWYFPDRTPEAFAAFLRDAITWMDEHPEQTTPQRLLLIYAWNELGEGGYLVPTRGDPDAAYLKTIRSIVL